MQWLVLGSEASDMRIFICFIFVIVLLHALLSGEACAASDRILFGLDGATWKRVLTDDQDVQATKRYKLILLRGVLDGMMFGQSPFFAPGSKYAMYVGTSYDHLIDAVDQFYSDYRNEKVFIVWALLVVSMELRGEPRAKIDAELQDFRQRAASKSIR
jgi:hypothetical protein